MNNDLISRSALRVEMEEYVMPILANNLMGAADAYYRTLHLLDEAPAVDAETVFKAAGLVKEAFEMAKSTLAPAQNWISVKDRLPDSQADVLVVAFWHECWQPMIGWHSDSGEKWRVLTSNGEREPGGVTYWMPLPNPPKEGWQCRLN